MKWNWNYRVEPPESSQTKADVYDALISRRVYKEGMPHEKAVGIILEGKGSHFDPDMVDVFMELADEFKAVAGRYVDSDADLEKAAFK